MCRLWSLHIIAEVCMDQPGKVASPARGQLNRQVTLTFLMPSFAPENLISWDGFGRPPCQPAHSPLSGWIRGLRAGFLPLPAAASIHSYLQLPSGQSRVLSGHGIACRWRSLPWVRRHRASSPEGSSSNTCCLFRYHHGPTNVRLSFPTPTIGLYL